MPSHHHDMLKHSETNLAGINPLWRGMQTKSLTVSYFLLYKSLPNQSSDDGFHPDSRLRNPRWCLFSNALQLALRVHITFTAKCLILVTFDRVRTTVQVFFQSHILKYYFCDVEKHYERNGSEIWAKYERKATEAPIMRGVLHFKRAKLSEHHIIYLINLLNL